MGKNLAAKEEKSGSLPRTHGLPENSQNMLGQMFRPATLENTGSN